MPTPNPSQSLELEQLTARLFALFPGADTVEHDVRRRGKSGILRQIDVLITKQIGPLLLTIVIDTKCKKKKVRRTDVFNVEDIREDVGAGLAVVVAPKGFNRGATQYAKAKNISLLKSINTADGGWKGRFLVSFQCHIRIVTYLTDQELSQDQVSLLNGTLSKSWDSWRLAPASPEGPRRFTVACPRPGLEDWLVDVILVEVQYFKKGTMPLEFFGVFNGQTQQFATGQMATEGILLSTIIRDWETFTEPDPKALSSYTLMAVRSKIHNGSIVIPMREGHYKLELTPANALLELSSDVVAVPFRFAFWPTGASFALTGPMIRGCKP